MSNFLQSLLSVVQDSTKAATFEDATTLATISGVVRSLTGEAPIVSTQDGYTFVSFTPSQQVKLRGMIDQAFNGTNPGAVRVDLAPVLYLPVLKRLIPLLLIVFALGYIAHRQ